MLGSQAFFDQRAAAAFLARCFFSASSALCAQDELSDVLDKALDASIAVAHISHERAVFGSRSKFAIDR